MTIMNILSKELDAIDKELEKVMERMNEDLKTAAKLLLEEISKRGKHLDRETVLFERMERVKGSVGLLIEKIDESFRSQNDNKESSSVDLSGWVHDSNFVIETEKVCSVCKVSRPFDDYGKQNGKTKCKPDADGIRRRGNCKRCENIIRTYLKNVPKPTATLRRLLEDPRQRDLYGYEPLPNDDE